LSAIRVISIKNGLKQGDALSPLLFNFALQNVIRKVQVHQDGFNLNGTHQLLVYADDVNISGGSVHTVKKNTEAFVVASNETGPEVNYDTTKYLVMSGEQNAGRSKQPHSFRAATRPNENIIQNFPLTRFP
jgi:hypothetical protein